MVIDEVSYTSIDDESCNFFCDFLVCWIALVEIGQTNPTTTPLCSSFVKNTFQKISLDINFRNARHISNITNNFIEQQFISNPFSSSVKSDGCFTSAQLEVELKLLETIDYDYLVNNKLFLDDHLSDRLIVIISDELADALSLDSDKMKKTWNACEIVVFTSNIFYLIQISGIEFQSVLLIIDVDFYQRQHNFAVNDAVSRAQYEVGIIARKTTVNLNYLKSYLKGDKANFINNLNLLRANEPMSSDWLKAKDLDLHEYEWWLDRLSALKSASNPEYKNLLHSQPPTICLQIEAIFSDSGNFFQHSTGGTLK